MDFCKAMTGFVDERRVYVRSLFSLAIFENSSADTYLVAARLYGGLDSGSKRVRALFKDTGPIEGVVTGTESC